MTRQEYKCWHKLHGLLREMRSRGFAYADYKAWYSEWILNASAVAASGNWDEVLVILQNVEDAYYQEWLDLRATEGRKAA
jgi:hypothetical protein